MIIFDLDGVLIDSRLWHYESLNQALSEVDSKYMISQSEQDTLYEGRPTSVKLKMLSESKGLPYAAHSQIQQRKQFFVQQIIKKHVCPSEKVTAILESLKSRGFELACCSNSIETSMRLILNKMQILHFFHSVYGNDNKEFCQQFPICGPKPHPGIYQFACLKNGLKPQEVMICEDSFIGRQSALDSGCFLCPVESAEHLTLELINSYIDFFNTKKNLQLSCSPWPMWILTPKMNVLIPMAGCGTRFLQSHPNAIKPLIPAHPKKFGSMSMIELVVRNLNTRSHFTFVVQRAHQDVFNLTYWLPTLTKNYESSHSSDVVIQDGVLPGAACSSLLARNIIAFDEPLLIANSDQFVECSTLQTFFYQLFHQKNLIDGGILTFTMDDAQDIEERKKWSYAEVNPQTHFVTKIYEKIPVGPHATVGIYFWTKGSDYVKYAEKMLQNPSCKVNGEFYIAPVYNLAIADGKKFIIHDVEKMWGLGTPKDLAFFQEHF